MDKNNYKLIQLNRRRLFIRNALAFITTIFIGLTNVYSQTDTTNPNHYEDLSLKDLLNIKIVSVSKSDEMLFDAPLSASVITKDEIRKTGCTSIMEALRLVPGMIVREQANGVYDIHLRGMDNVPPNAPFDITSNTTTLVMINNRPVYSYLRGGTFWETLPVDLNDVEKIEVIRGPAAALYGPNAVNGVINIITRETKKDGLSVVFNSQAGSEHTFINNASIGFQSRRWSVIASGNYQDRNRAQTSYFEYSRNESFEHPDYFISFDNDTVRNVNQLYPDPNLAMHKYAGNVFLNYDGAKKIKLTLSTGLQHSWVQRISTENELTPLSNAASDSRYVDMHATIKNLSAQFSYNGGTQLAEFEPGNKYDFNTLDANVEYNYIRGNFSLKPGVSYRSAIYDDTKYSDTKHRAGIFNSRGIISSESVSLRGDYKLLNNKLRLVAGASSSTFNYPDATYFACEFAATYKINKHHLLRAVYSKAPRSSNIFDTYVDQTIFYYPSGYRNYTEMAIVGNKNLKLLTANMREIGYRGNLTKSFAIDLELFDVDVKNFSVPVVSSPIIEFDGVDTVHETPIRLTNLPLKLDQQGITLSLIYNSKKLQVKPFITLQHTIIKNYSKYNNTPDAIPPMAPPDPSQQNIYSGMGTEENLKSTPSAFGGASVNYAATSRFNINVSAYYYSSQTYYHLSNTLFNDGVRGIDHIKSKLIINTNVSYQPAKGLHIFCTGKNLLNNKSREFFHTDEVPSMLLAGISYEF